MEKCNPGRCVSVTFVGVGAKVFPGVGSQRPISITFYVKDFAIIVSMYNTKLLSDLCNCAGCVRHINDSRNTGVSDRQSNLEKGCWVVKIRVGIAGNG